MVDGAADSPTVSLGREAGSDRPAPPPRQFLPGTKLGDRYRIVERLGRGGMGEVYHADDLHLGHPVALKFLPDRMTADDDAMARLRNEVRVARQVSQPNVCRVYDICEADGHLFLAMEYIDGEDLASVLRRLGRPSRDKSVEIARQICLGLASAHEAGVFHGDLKPDNIMIDGRGRVRITDFGLASLARETGAASFGGTPANMAPELFHGAPAGTATEVYALGAVLYELFTGVRAFRGETVAELRRQHETSAPHSPSEITPEIEPVVEAIITRCLDNYPARRPGSVLAVAAALPGQDLVALALAAGQTPSPDVVAEAGGRGALPPLVAAALFLTVVAGVLAIAGMNRHVSLHGLAPPAKRSVVIADTARGILARLGVEPPAYSALGWETYDGYLDHIRDTDPSTDRWTRLGERRPSVYCLWYRESPVPLVPRNFVHEVRYQDPPLSYPGMAGLKFDDSGRLAILHLVPPAITPPRRHRVRRTTAGCSKPPVSTAATSTWPTRSGRLRTTPTRGWRGSDTIPSTPSGPSGSRRPRSGAGRSTST